ncbi:MAG: hypothetical protein J7J91_09660 [Deltaproteobacteria bacterium]|nr:hypothetical protein [Deltaproteobacteria bacterium]
MKKKKLNNISKIIEELPEIKTEEGVMSAQRAEELRRRTVEALREAGIIE